MTFSPPATTPAVPGQDGKYYYILGMPSTASTLVPSGATTVPAAGTSTDYGTSGSFTGGSGRHRHHRHAHDQHLRLVAG